MKLKKMPRTEPIFKSILGSSWDNLPKIMLKHYANKPFSKDIVIARGKTDIEFGWLITLFLPLLRLFGALVPYKGKDIDVTVRFLSEADSAAYGLERTFKLPGGKKHIFHSKLIQVKEDIMVEMMKSGIGWRHRFYFDGEKIVLEHRGYVFQVFGRLIPVPIGLFLGKGYAMEQAIDDDNFRMRMSITHPAFGIIYEYKGEFGIPGKAR